MNSVVLVGRLTADPKAFNNNEIVTFTVAINNGKDYDADFIDCKAFKKTAELIIKYFSKGNMMALSGRIKPESWTNTEGEKRHKQMIVANTVTFIDKKKDNDNTVVKEQNNSEEEKTITKQTTYNTNDENKDLPW